ncbi:hypothetical protein NM208_g8159 [Fusarium decemcellulare]|uniref:Uncharacterized protein n=1 Tax=Fusarium decemcellulare TaxID=57161 RepID=A0ACC1S6J9_9HYPO|nr:hypothetical protein NM208_g8159 [Fusarium decemcellulare]
MSPINPGGERQFVDKILDENAAKIEQIRETFQAPSFAVGVIRKGERFFRGFGYANHETRRKPDDKTIYGVGSCTKAFTATILARLAHDGALDLDVPVSDNMPDLKTACNPVVGETMTTRDMASHCVGLGHMLYRFIGKHGMVFTDRSDVPLIFNSLPKVAEFRSEWQYNNWLYALSGVLITQLSGKSLGSMAEEEIFSKLAMERSSFTSPADDNFATSYLVFDNRPAQPMPLPSLADGDAFDSSGAMRSCVSDMLTWADALMKARRASLREALAEIQEPYFPLADDPNQQYAMGLYSLHLPTPEINAVTNIYANPSYILGQDSRPRAVIGHPGEYGGFLSVYWTFPEDETAIVVLCNSFGINGNPANIVAQLIAQELFDMKPRVEFVQVAESTVANARKRWTDLRGAWISRRVLGTEPAALDSYTGRFYNVALAMELQFTVLQVDPAPRLCLVINGRPEQDFKLTYYHHDTWTFLPETRDECIFEGYSSYVSRLECVILEFHTFLDDMFQEVKWQLDPDPRDSPTVFQRLYL